MLSSSNLISNEPPKLSLEKLAVILQTYNLSYEDLHESIENLEDLSVHVVGDSIVDVLTETSIYGGQTKTPTLSVKLMGEKKFVGGAAIVALHLKAAGANVKFTTILGEDANSDFIKYELESAGVEMNIVQENMRPTTEKRAIVCENYRLLKIDTVDNTPCTVESEQRFAKHITNTKADIVIFSDFRHGIFNKKSIPILISAVPNETFKVADSQVASRWGNICDFNDFDLITPNEKEARFATADQDSTIGPLAIKLFSQANCKNLILKLGSKGAIALMSPNKNSGPRMISLDAFTTKSIDPVGAGDAMIAYSSLVLQKTESLPVAFIIGSIAAACVSEREGNSPVSLTSIKEKLFEIQKLSDYELR